MSSHLERERDIFLAHTRGIARAATKRFPLLSLTEALRQFLLADTTVEGYLERNRIATDEMGAFEQSERVVHRMQEVFSAPDEEARAALQHELDMWRYESVDIEALHRRLQADTRRIKAEFLK